MSATPTSLDKTSDPLVGELLPMVQAAANAKVIVTINQHTRATGALGI